MKTLSKEIKERKNNGEKDIVIRNFQIVKKKTAPPDGVKTRDRTSYRWDKIFWKR